MTASIISARDIDAARQRKRGTDALPATAAAALPPVSTNLVDALFLSECDYRTDQGALRRAA